MNWYAVRTRPSAEYVAAAELGKDGMEVFLPRIIDLKPRPGHADVPLFPGYLFVRCNPSADGWPTFRPAHRVLGWLSIGDETPSIPNEAIVDLRRRVDSMNGENGLWRQYRTGEKVRVVTGAIDSFGQILEEARSPQGRAQVLLEFMGRLVKTRVPWKNLRPDEGQTELIHHPPRRTRGRGRWIAGSQPRLLPSG